MGSDKNPMYLDFWNPVSKIWKEKFNVTPVLGLIGDEESELEETNFGLIKKFKIVENVNIGLQSQIVRFFLPKFLDGICLMSDIDMIPLSKIYFEENSKYIEEDNMVIFSSNNSQTVNEKMYPICYVGGHSNILKKVFELDNDWNSFCQNLSKRNEKWYTDQKFLFEKSSEFNSETSKLILLEREWGNNRVDRSKWDYKPELVKEGYYIDCHSLRPYNIYKSEIDKLIELIC
jgi:hypothetical protein